MLLAKLLQTLSDEEIKKIREDFRLAERSRLIFERIAASPSSPPNSADLTKAFRITKENFYSICSEIVDECVRILASKEEFSTLIFFRSKYLYRPFITEAMRTEKQLIAEKDKVRLEKFYKFMFKNMSDFPISLVDLDLLYEFGMKWHRAQEHPPADEDLYIKIRIIFLRIASLPSRKKMNLSQMSAYSRSLLDPIKELAESSTNPFVRNEYYQAEWKACVYGGTEKNEEITWLGRSLDVIRKNRDRFDTQREEVIELQMAYELAMKHERAIEALETFRKFHKGQSPETSRGALFLLRFSRVALLAKDFETCRKIVEDFGHYQVVKSTPSIYITVLMLQAMLDLLEGKPHRSVQFLETAKSLNDENYFLAYEVQIRGLETVIAFKCGDTHLADQLTQRNIKWLRTRRISLLASAWIYFYQVIDYLIRAKITGEPIRPSLLEHFNTEFRTEHPDYFMLLQGELQK